MELKIGIENVAREVTLDVEWTAEQVTAAYTSARTDDAVLTLTDRSGRQTMIPARSIGYIEFGQEHTRPVGFGA